MSEHPDIQGGAAVRSAGASARHMPQLDSLRAFAVGAVLLHHYVPALEHNSFIRHVSPGLLGVKLFFVLSGFLITGILLRARSAAASPGGSTRALRSFYVRRTLRIFPLYYAVVFFCIAINLGEARELAPWLLTYTLNFGMMSIGWFVRYFSHLWSLAVEEQFYLLWPWIVLFVPRRALLPVILAMIALGPMTRAVYAIGWNLFEWSDTLGFYVATPACFDSLGMGAVLALATTGDFAPMRLRRWLRRSAPVLALGAGVLLVVVGRLAPDLLLDAIFLDLCFAAVFAWIISQAMQGVRGVVGKILDCRALQYVGKISYGVYVYHLLTPPLALALLAWVGSSAPPAGATAMLSTVLTLVVASLSWRLFERPINALKDRLAPPAGNRGETALGLQEDSPAGRAA